MHWDRREIRSLRLKNKIKNYKEIIEIQSQICFFIMPKNTTILTLNKEWQSFNCKLITISQKTINLLCKTTPENLYFKNLLKGNIILVLPLPNKIFSYKNILQSNNIELRCALLNGKLYRNLEDILNLPDNKNLLLFTPITNILTQLQQFYWFKTKQYSIE